MAENQSIQHRIRVLRKKDFLEIRIPLKKYNGFDCIDIGNGIVDSCIIYYYSCYFVRASFLDKSSFGFSDWWLVRTWNGWCFYIYLVVFWTRTYYYF